MPKTIYLKGRYEVALSEIQYPHSWSTFTKQDELVLYWTDDVFDTTKQHKRVKIPEGYYTTMDELCMAINYAYDEVRTTDTAYINFLHDPIRRRIKVKLEQNHGFSVNRELGEVLGLQPYKFYGTSQYADSVSDVKRGFYTLYTYCSVCEPQVVSDHYVPLLRCVGIQGKDGVIITKTFTDPHYVTVNTNKFDTIEVNIKNDVGEDVSFRSGKVICKLHFRPKAI